MTQKQKHRHAHPWRTKPHHGTRQRVREPDKETRDEALAKHMTQRRQTRFTGSEE